MAITRPRGTNDFLPEETAKWQKIESMLRDLCQIFGFGEIRTPIFEETDLFCRGVGDTTDIVQKEMYTFNDQGGRSLTLRPENTASAARAYLENKLFAAPQPVKLYYLGPMFRYERPQAGRFRQFHQFGIELFGSDSPFADAEVIGFAWELYRRFGLKDLRLEINSVGCSKCRPNHREALQEYLRPHLNDLCQTCQDRFARNPLRIFDCKSPVCQNLIQGSPTMREHLCPECADHFEAVKKALITADIPFQINDNMVRGLDYYTKTAFEIITDQIGAQGTICGGGRYDGLIAEIGGGDSVPGVGFAMGLERLLAVLRVQEHDLETGAEIDVFVATVTDEEEETGQRAFALAMDLRRMGFKVQQDLMARSLKAQLKAADKTGARYVIIIGGEELLRNTAVIKDMKQGEQVEVPLQEIKQFFVSTNK